MFLASLLPEQGGEVVLPPPMPAPDMETSESFRLFRMSEEMRSILTIILAIIWSGIVIMAIWRVSSQIYNWLKRRSGDMEGMEVEHLKGAFWADLLMLLNRFGTAVKRLLRRFLMRERPVELPGAIMIRNTYRQLIRWAASRGYPRASDQTPYEYLGILAAVLPDAYDDLNLITRHYVQVRYSTAIPTTEDRDAVNRSWHRVRRQKMKRPAGNATFEQEEQDNG